MLKRSRNLLLLLLVLAVPPAWGLPVPNTIAQATLTLLAEAGLQGYYQPGAAIPVRITVQSRITRDVTVIASEPDSPTHFTRRVSVAAGEARTFTLYLYPTEPVDIIQVRAEHEGVLLAEQLVPVIPLDGLIGVLAAEAQLPPLALPSPTDPLAPLIAVPLTPATLPAHPAGLANLSVLLIPALPATLSEAQHAALLGWLWQGGQLVLGGGNAAAENMVWLPASLPRAQIGPTTTLPTASLSIAAMPPPPRLTGVRLHPAPPSISAGSPAAPLWVSTPIGRGTLTQLAFDPTHAALNAWQGAPYLWASLLGPTAAQRGSVRELRQQQLTATSTTLPPPTLATPALLWAMLLLYLLAVALLTSSLMRQNQIVLVWRGLLLLALLFGLLGSGLAWLLRPDLRLLSTAHLIEQIAPDVAMQTSALSMAVPTTSTHTLHITPPTLFQPHRPSSTAANIPISGFAGELAQDGPLAVQVGSTQISGGLAQWMLDMPAVPARIEIVDDTITAHVSNPLDQPLRDVLVAYGGQVVRLATIAPGGTASAMWPYRYGQREPAPPPDGSTIINDLIGDSFDAFAQLGPDEQTTIGLIQAAIGRGTLPPDDGAWLFARLDTPPASLHLVPPSPTDRSVTVLAVRPQLVAQGAIALPTGWLQLDPNDPNNQLCPVRGGRGVQVQSVPAQAILRLPLELSRLQATDLTLFLAGEQRIPAAGVRIELYDWDAQAWRQIEDDGTGRIAVPSPARFVQAGTLRLRMDGRINAARCVAVTAQVQGQIP